QSRAHLRRARRRGHAARVPAARPCADRPRHRRDYAGGDRRQHPRRAHRHPARPRRVRRLDEMAAGPEVRALVRNATMRTMNDALDVVHGALSIRDGRIESVGDEPSGTHDTVIDARGAYLLPGFIQTHVHLCQTLFRGHADDMALLDWLRTRVWPME